MYPWHLLQEAHLPNMIHIHDIRKTLTFIVKMQNLLQTNKYFIFTLNSIKWLPQTGHSKNLMSWHSEMGRLSNISVESNKSLSWRYTIHWWYTDRCNRNDKINISIFKAYPTAISKFVLTHPALQHSQNRCSLKIRGSRLTWGHLEFFTHVFKKVTKSL